METKTTSFRLPKDILNKLESLCISMGKNKTDIVIQLIKDCTTNCNTTVLQKTKEVAISPTPIYAHAPTPDRYALRVSDRGLKGGNSFLDENGTEIPLPPSSPELDAKQKEIQARWKLDYEESLKRRGVKP